MTITSPPNPLCLCEVIFPDSGTTLMEKRVLRLAFTARIAVMIGKLTDTKSQSHFDKTKTHQQNETRYPTSKTERPLDTSSLLLLRILKAQHRFSSPEIPHLPPNPHLRQLKMSPARRHQKKKLGWMSSK
ncbi:hypothetical protein CEXT_86161 [Caerostris extrusa]|uniref:Uncharacterized protein n=1 Tax=Caerostris extrusa TaxID=172846 RepID=A0AAV4WSU8_CAEEX|nr:hypothetical protein CEXT_86161 [Caerostris extrusa]